MTEPIIFNNNTDFEENIYNIYTYMMYKGQPFTGTIIIEGNPMEDNLLGNKEIMEFKDGNAHGRCLEYHRNGQLISDILFNDGKFICEKEWFPDGQPQEEYDYDLKKGKEWYKNGQLKKLWDDKENFCWDEDGILVMKNSTWFYKNGQMISEKLPNDTLLYFSSTGELAFKKERFAEKKFPSGVGTYYEYKKYYYNDVLNRFLGELFTDHYQELGNNNYDIYSLFGWVSAVYCSNPKNGHQLIDILMAHPSRRTSEHASSLKRLALKKETGSKERTYCLEKDPLKIII